MGFPPTSTPEDIPKLHAESNQLRNQQFTLSTLGVGAVALSSWLLPTLPANVDGGVPQAAVAVFLLVLLGVLFMWSMSLRRLIAAISCYLDLRGASEWEPLFLEFSTRAGTAYRSQTVSVCLLYLVLGCVPVGEYASLVIVAGRAGPLDWASVAVWSVACAYVVTLSVTTLRRHRYGSKIRENWTAVLGERFPRAVERSQVAGAGVVGSSRRAVSRGRMVGERMARAEDIEE